MACYSVYRRSPVTHVYGKDTKPMQPGTKSDSAFLALRNNHSVWFADIHPLEIMPYDQPANEELRGLVLQCYTQFFSLPILTERGEVYIMDLKTETAIPGPRDSYANRIQAARAIRYYIAKQWVLIR